jgi:hypothetical protein
MSEGRIIAFCRSISRYLGMSMLCDAVPMPCEAIMMMYICHVMLYGPCDAVSILFLCGTVSGTYARERAVRCAWINDHASMKTVLSSIKGLALMITHGMAPVASLNNTSSPVPLFVTSCPINMCCRQGRREGFCCSQSLFGAIPSNCNENWKFSFTTHTQRQ